MSTENLFTNWLPSELLSINAFKRLGEIVKMRRKSWKQVNLQLVLMLIRNLGANIFQRIKLQFTITIYRPRSVHQRSKYLKYLGWPYYKASRPSKILISCLAKLARLFSVCNVMYVVEGAKHDLLLALVNSVTSRWNLHRFVKLPISYWSS